MLNKCDRNKRISQEIKKNIAIILKKYVKDPRINMVTVSDIYLSYDLSNAKVFVTLLNDYDLEQRKISINVLQNAAGYIQNILCKVMKLRIIPKLIFIYDQSLVESIRMCNIINRVIHS